MPRMYVCVFICIYICVCVSGGHETGSCQQDDFESVLAKLKADNAISERLATEGRIPSKYLVYNESTEQKADGPPSQIDRLEPHNFQQVTPNPNEVPSSYSESNAAATGKQAATSVLPPFSGELRVDTGLKLSDGDFKRRMEEFYKNKQLSAVNQLKATPAFPTPYVLARFAWMAYTDYQREEPEPPDGWKLLTTASHFAAMNGYFGIAYWHPEHQQVVIAHRGTDPKNVGALITDIKGVYFNNYVDQISSASTFANKVVGVLQQIEQDNGVSFELFFTGHSLGGWLAQITTFTTKYLEEDTGIFLKRLKGGEHEPLGSHDVPHSYHPHTVVFDSPGCNDMLLQMTGNFDVRHHGRSIDLQHLDITSYLSAPNLINTRNSHLGTVYRIFFDLSHMDSLEEHSTLYSLAIHAFNIFVEAFGLGFLSKHTTFYNLATHRIDKIVEAFDPETGQVRKDDKGELKIREVVDWPVSAGLTGDAEYNDFFKWAEHLNNYHPEVMDTSPSYVPEGYSPLRYQTKAYDKYTRSLSIFTEDEREFLKSYRPLCHVSEFDKPEDLFCVINNTEAQQEAVQKLLNFELGTKNVTCPDSSTLQALIPYVKRLVRLFPRIKENVYQCQTKCYIETIHQSALDFNPDALCLREFLTSDQQIWQLRMTNGDAWTGLTKVYRVFQKTSSTVDGFSEGNYTVLTLKQLLKVNGMINFNTLLASMETPHLLMIACETNQPVNDELRDMFNELFNTLKEKKNLKLILTTPSDGNIATFLQQIAIATLGEELKTADVQLTWRNLTRSSQRKISEKAVIFQGRTVALNQLTSAEAVPNSFPLADLLQEKEIRIGEEGVKSTLHGYNEKYYIDRTFHHNIVIRQDIVSDKREGKFADLLAYDEKEFKQLCQQNPASNVHWLVKDNSGEIIWQQSQGNLKTLRKYIDVQKSHSYGPTDLDKLLKQARHHKVMIIADKAGMGKSTVLTHLSKQIKQQFPAHWLVKIDLNDYTQLLEAQKGKKMDKERVLEFVSKEVLKLESRLEKELFKKNFQGNETNKVVIMLDGFDEISPYYKQTVIDMLQVLKQTSLEQLWVTTRPHLREELEDKLQQLAYTLEPFSELEQVKFLNKFWLQNSNLEATNQSRLEKYATALIRKLAQSVSDKDKEFTGIPLQTRMLAEAFQEEFESFYRSQKSKPELPQKLDLLGLYRRFIDRKYNIYYEEKCRMAAGNVAAKEQREHYLKDTQLQHQLLALQALFTEDQVTRLKINSESRSLVENLARIGIVQRNHDGRPQFIHRTFAEYYVADFLINILTETTKQQIQEQEFLLNIVLLQREFHVIRAFLDGLLEKSKLSKEALKEYGEKLDEQWKGREVLGRPMGLRQTALSQAVTEDNIHITGFLLDSLKSGEHSDALRKMLLATDVLGRTAWHMAAKNGNVRALEKLWERADEVTPTVTYSLPLLKEQMLLAQDRDGKTAWHLATENCNEEVLEKIWRWAKEVLVNPNELMEKLVLVQSNNGQTAWHLATEKYSAEILVKLWGWAKEAELNPGELRNKLLLGQDSEGRTVWHVAAKSGSVEILDKLWGWAKVEELHPDYLKRVLFVREDRCMASTWGCAILNGSVDVLQKVWGWAEELQLTTNEMKSKLFLGVAEDGNTAIHPLVYRSRLLFLDKSSVSSKDEDRNTTIDWAAGTDNIELLQKLWYLCKQTKINTDEVMTESLLAAWHRAVAGGYLQILDILWLWAGEVRLNRHEFKRTLLLDRNEKGERAWQVAETRGDIKVLEKLLDWSKEEKINPDY